MLRRPGLTATTGRSKAPRGLFVLPQDARICTGTSISPGPLPRQRSTRDAIRAGRNLPDKEFRYLRTIIVIAAVHQGFGSPRKGVPLTVWHRAGVSPHTVSCDLAETCVFGKQSVEPIPCDPLPLPRRAGTQAEVPLLPKVRGQFAEFLGRGSPVHLGTLIPAYQCRCGVRARTHSVEAFLAGRAACDLPVPEGTSSASPLTSRLMGFATAARLRAYTAMASRPLALTSRAPHS